MRVEVEEVVDGEKVVHRGTAVVHQAVEGRHKSHSGVLDGVWLEDVGGVCVGMAGGGVRGSVCGLGGGRCGC